MLQAVGQPLKLVLRRHAIAIDMVKIYVETFFQSTSPPSERPIATDRGPLDPRRGAPTLRNHGQYANHSRHTLTNSIQLSCLQTQPRPDMHSYTPSFPKHITKQIDQDEVAHLSEVRYAP